jgi:hypothetical protein
MSSYRAKGLKEYLISGFNMFHISAFAVLCHYICADTLMMVAIATETYFTSVHLLVYCINQYVSLTVIVVIMKPQFNEKRLPFKYYTKKRV